MLLKVNSVKELGIIFVDSEEEEMDRSLWLSVLIIQSPRLPYPIEDFLRPPWSRQAQISLILLSAEY